MSCASSSSLRRYNPSDFFLDNQSFRSIEFDRQTALIGGLPVACMLGMSIEQAGLLETVWLKVVPHLVAMVALVEIDYLRKILGYY